MLRIYKIDKGLNWRQKLGIRLTLLLSEMRLDRR